MRSLDFYGLTRSLQDRFIESSRGAAVPVPLAVAPTLDTRSIRFGAGALASVCGWGGFILLGFGRLESSLALGGIGPTVVHCTFAGLTAYLGMRSYLAAWEVSRSPYPDGFYLFPGGLVEAKGARLIDWDVASIKSVDVEGASIVVTLADGRVHKIPVGDKARAIEGKHFFEDSREKWLKSSENEGLERARLHPLVESGVPNPLAPTRPHERKVLLPFLTVLFASLVIGVTLGTFVSYVRAQMSEKALYRAAIQQDTVESYRAYLARGGSRAEVKETYLPRAELKKAIAAGSVEAIEAFIARNPTTKIQAEVTAVHRAALLRELDKAKEKGLPALEALKQKYPAHTLIEPELVSARGEAFERALESYRAISSPKHPEVLSAVEALLAYAKEHGPGVAIRWTHDFPQSRDMLDSIVSKSEKYYLGRKCLPTQYFLGDRATARQEKLSLAFIERMKATFQSDVLDFKLGALAPEENKKLDEVTTPTITFRHSESLSGGFVGGRPKTMILGATIVMTATLEVPGKEPVVFRWQAWKAPQFAELEGKDVPEIYESMVGTAFEEFSKAYLRTWFGEG